MCALLIENAFISDGRGQRKRKLDQYLVSGDSEQGPMEGISTYIYKYVGRWLDGYICM